MLILRYVQNKLCQSKRKLFRQSWNLQTSKSQSCHLLLLKSNFILNDKLSVEKEYFNAAFELVSLPWNQCLRHFEFGFFLYLQPSNYFYWQILSATLKINRRWDGPLDVLTAVWFKVYYRFAHLKLTWPNFREFLFEFFLKFFPVPWGFFTRFASKAIGMLWYKNVVGVGCPLEGTSFIYKWMLFDIYDVLG